MKRAKIYVGLAIILLVSLGAIALDEIFGQPFKDTEQQHSDKGNLVVIYNKCHFDDFKIINDKVVFLCTVDVKNTTNKPIYFNARLSVGRELIHGLVSDRQAISVNPDIEEPKLYCIEPKQEAYFTIDFWARHGLANTKLNRLIPGRIYLTEKSSEAAKSVHYPVYMGENWVNGMHQNVGLNSKQTVKRATSNNYSTYSGEWNCAAKSTGLSLDIDSSGNVKGIITTVIYDHVPSSYVVGTIKNNVLTSKLDTGDGCTGTITLTFCGPKIIKGTVKLDQKGPYSVDNLAEGDMLFNKYGKLLKKITIMPYH